MYTEEILKDFPLQALFELMVLKLQEFELLEKQNVHVSIRSMKIKQLALIRKVIEEKTLKEA